MTPPRTPEPPHPRREDEGRAAFACDPADCLTCPHAEPPRTAEEHAARVSFVAEPRFRR